MAEVRSEAVTPYDQKGSLKDQQREVTIHAHFSHPRRPSVRQAAVMSALACSCLLTAWPFGTRPLRASASVR